MTNTSENYAKAKKSNRILLLSIGAIKLSLITFLYLSRNYFDDIMNGYDAPDIYKKLYPIIYNEVTFAGVIIYFILYIHFNFFKKQKYSDGIEISNFKTNEIDGLENKHVSNRLYEVIENPTNKEIDPYSSRANSISAQMLILLGCLFLFILIMSLRPSPEMLNLYALIALAASTAIWLGVTLLVPPQKRLTSPTPTRLSLLIGRIIVVAFPIALATASYYLNPSFRDNTFFKIPIVAGSFSLIFYKF